MTLEQLRVFVAVAERQHVTRAAEALHIAQSAASAAVATLEARHGVRLFDRLGRGINLEIAVADLGPVLEALAATGWPLFVAPETKTDSQRLGRKSAMAVGFGWSALFLCGLGG